MPTNADDAGRVHAGRVQTHGSQASPGKLLSRSQNLIFFDENSSKCRCVLMLTLLLAGDFGRTEPKGDCGPCCSALHAGPAANTWVKPGSPPENAK